MVGVLTKDAELLSLRQVTNKLVKELEEEKERTKNAREKQDLLQYKLDEMTQVLVQERSENVVPNQTTIPTKTIRATSAEGIPEPSHPPIPYHTIVARQASPRQAQEHAWSDFVVLAKRFSLGERDLILVSNGTLLQLIAHCGITNPVDIARIELQWRIKNQECGIAVETEQVTEIPPPPVPVQLPPRQSVVPVVTRYPESDLLTDEEEAQLVNQALQRARDMSRGRSAGLRSPSRSSYSTSPNRKLIRNDEDFKIPTQRRKPSLSSRKSLSGNRELSSSNPNRMILSSPEERRGGIRMSLSPDRTPPYLMSVNKLPKKINCHNNNNNRTTFTLGGGAISDTRSSSVPHRRPFPPSVGNPNTMVCTDMFIRGNNCFVVVGKKKKKNRIMEKYLSSLNVRHSPGCQVHLRAVVLRREASD